MLYGVEHRVEQAGLAYQRPEGRRAAPEGDERRALHVLKRRGVSFSVFPALKGEDFLCKRPTFRPE